MKRKLALMNTINRWELKWKVLKFKWLDTKFRWRKKMILQNMIYLKLNPWECGVRYLKRRFSRKYRLIHRKHRFIPRMHRSTLFRRRHSNFKKVRQWLEITKLRVGTQLKMSKLHLCLCPFPNMNMKIGVTSRSVMWYLLINII